jgi:DNA polymerase-1
MFGSPQEPPKIKAPAVNASHPGIEQRQVTVVDSMQKLESLVSLLDSAAVISFDTETTSTDQMRAELVGISLAVEPGQILYPVGHRQGLAAARHCRR